MNAVNQTGLGLGLLSTFHRDGTRPEVATDWILYEVQNKVRTEECSFQRWQSDSARRQQYKLFSHKAMSLPVSIHSYLAGSVSTLL